MSTLHDAIAPELPSLRRYARALTGSQTSGDALTAATLEAILADPTTLERSDIPRISLFGAFSTIWRSAAETQSDQETSALEAKAQEHLVNVDPRVREALLLFSLEDFSPSAIGAIMGVSADEAATLAEAGIAAIRDETRSRVMIIEDEPIIAMDLQGIIEELGHECVGIADTRTTAAALASETQPDLVLADIQLADGSSGIDAVRDLLAERSMPVIFITAYPERLLTGTRPEPTFLIAKPFKRSQVEASVSQALFFGTTEAIDTLEA